MWGNVVIGICQRCGESRHVYHRCEKRGDRIEDVKRNFRATFACADTIREARNKAAKL
jgi:hypothetical protein